MFNITYMKFNFSGEWFVKLKLKSKIANCNGDLNSLVRLQSRCKFRLPYMQIKYIYKC